MAAITSTVVALGGVGLSAAQAIKANKDQKKADAAALQAEQAMRNVREENVMKQVQVPTLGYDLAQEAQAQRDVSQIAALQGAGAAGVIGGIGKVAQAGAAADLQLAAKAGQQQYQRDLAVAQAGQGIEQRRATREFNIESAALAGAQRASQEAQLRKQQAAQGIFSGLLSAAGSAQLAGQALGIGSSKPEPQITSLTNIPGSPIPLIGLGMGTSKPSYLDNLAAIQQSNMLAAAGQNP